jgi:LemA protein
MAFSNRFAVAALVSVAAVGVSGCGYNTIPTQEEAAKAQWAEVQNQYQRRSDLIGNLVATVQGAAAQERAVLTEIAEARASATRPQFDASTITDPAKFAEFQAAQDRLTGVFGRLMSITENYPELRSLESFQTLQSQIEGTENRIAIARRDYNAAVQTYNTTLRTFPNVIWANTVHGGSKPMQLFQASAGAERAPQVKF